MSASGEWSGGLALLVRRPAARRGAARGAALRRQPADRRLRRAPGAVPEEAVPAAAAAVAEAEIAERLQAARVQAARDEGYAAGLEAGLRQAADDRSAREAAALEAIAAALKEGGDAARQAADEAARDVARLLLAALDAALPAAAARLAPESAAGLAATLEPLLRDGVAVTLFVAAGEAEAAAARIGAMPRLAVEEDAALAPGDARASWRGGDREGVAGRAARGGGGDHGRTRSAGGMTMADTESFEAMTRSPRARRRGRRRRRRGRDLEAVYDIPVQVSAVLGRATMQVSQLLKLGRGAVVELDRKLGEAVDIYVNNRLVARGEVVMVDDNRLGVTMTEIVKAERVG